MDWNWWFFNRFLLYKRKFSDCNLFRRSQSLLLEKNRCEFWCESKSWNFWAPSYNFAFDSAQIMTFFPGLRYYQENFEWEPNGRFQAGNYEEKQFEGKGFTMSKASFGGIGESELPIKDRSIWFFNQVCLLKCKGFDGHSDRTNQNSVDLEQNDFEYRDFIHIIKTFLGNFRV